jgi:hypothetical protein
MQFVDIYEIQQGGRAIEFDFDAIILNPVVSTIPNGGRSNF